jgi:hypothetical protein
MDEKKKQTDETLPGEPGRTPGSAEGEREDVEQTLEEQEKK